MTPLEKYGVPVNLDTERFVLGLILIDAANNWPSVAGTLTKEDFGLTKHRTILNAIRSLDESGKKIDRAMVSDELMRRGELESVDGFSYIASLDEGLPLLSNFDEYVRSLRDYRLRRDLIRAARRIENMAVLGTETPSASLDRAVSMVTGIADGAESDSFPSLANIIARHGGINGWMAERAVSGMKTGYRELDEVTGGLMPTDLWVIAGPTGGGKSTFTRNLAYQMASAGLPGAIISLEMGEEEVTDGLLALHSGLRISDLKRGIVADRDEYRAGMLALHELGIHVEYKTPTLQAIRSGLMRLRNQTGCRWAIVDFIQLMQSLVRFGNREQEVASFAYGLKRLAIELGIGIIALSQLSRDHAKLKRKPELTDLRESGSIEFSANVVGFVWSEFQETTMQEYPAEFLLRKQRSGAGHADIPFGWVKSCGRFIERAHE